MRETFTPTDKLSKVSAELFAAMGSLGVAEAPRLLVGGIPYELPRQLAEAFMQILEYYKDGHPISLIAHEKLLTTQDLADFLGVSRPTAIKLLETHKIPVDLVNRHRRVAFGDALKLQRIMRDNQRDALSRMRRLELEFGLLDE